MTNSARRRIPALALGLLLSLLPSRALADDEIDANAVQAEKLASEAETKQAAGAYGDAVELYLEAYRASPAAVLLFNVASLYDRRLASVRGALDYYRRALAAPDLEESLAAQARARIAALEAKEEVPTRPVVVAPPGREGGMHPLAIGGLATAGAGAISLGLSGVLALVAKSKDDEANAFCDGDRCTDSRGLELTEDATGLANAATATFVVGAALVASGLVLWLVAPRRDKIPVQALVTGARF